MLACGAALCAPHVVAATPLAQGLAQVVAPVGAEAALFADAADGTLDSHTLLDAALIASGVADAQLATQRARVNAALSPAIARARLRTDLHQRGDALLRALHDTVLLKYDEDATDVDQAVRTGSYNCVSSAILFLIAADGMFEAQSGMLSQRHAFARVSIDHTPIDVEATTKEGFNIDRAKVLTAELTARLLHPGEDPNAVKGDLQHPEAVPTLSLIAGVYANRSVALMQRGALSQAATALDRATRLASGSARTRFATWRASVINTGATALAAAQRWDDALALLTLALEGTSAQTRALLRQNIAQVHAQKAQALQKNADWGAAMAELVLAEEFGIAHGDIDALKAVVNGHLAAGDHDQTRCQRRDAGAVLCLSVLAQTLLRAGDAVGALSAARQAMALDAHDKNARASLFFALQQRAKIEADAQHCVDNELTATEMQTVSDSLATPFQSAPMVGACWAQLGAAHYQAKRWDEAAHAFARARVFLPREQGLVLNVARVEFNRALIDAHALRCEDARVRGLRAVDSDVTLQSTATAMLEACANDRAVAAAKRKAWADAVVELRRGLNDAPGSVLLTRNLQAMSENLLRALVAQHQCSDARALLDDVDEARRAALLAALNSCR